MLAKLQGEVASWQAADSTTKAIPAHYIAVTAQELQEKQHAPHAYHKQIDTIISWAKPINALVLDIQGTQQC
jgi:hypothetical protein